MIRYRAKFNVTVIAAALTVLLSSTSHAAVQKIDLPAPHSGYTCARCHTAHPDLGSNGFSNACLTCHRPGVPAGEGKPFTAADAANRFGRLSTTATLRQISHGWEGSATLAAAGAQAPQSPELAASQFNGRLACSACHTVHTPKGAPLLRLANDRDQLCLDCHRSRYTTDHTRGSHPVNVGYTSADAAPKKAPGDFYPQPRNANPANASSAPKLTNDRLLCTTCHRVHYADSNSATFDNATSYFHLGSGDGNLLRSDLKGATSASVNVCSGCHIKPNHDANAQNIQCADCHAAHVANDPQALSSDEQVPNAFLVRRYINVSTAAGAVRNRRVFLQQTGALQRPYKAADGSGICQACHAVPEGGGFPAEHALDLAPAATCSPCHPHDSSSGAFAAAGGSCDACHGYPPTSSSQGGPDGAAAGYGQNEAQTAHRTHAAASGKYRYTCATCHRGNQHLKGNYQDLFRDNTASTAALFGTTPIYNGSDNTCSVVYCHSDGAPRDPALTPVLTTRTTPAWIGGNGAISGCSACHAALPATNAHPRHLGAGLACALCHSATVDSTGTISSNGQHVNGTKEVAFAPALGAATWTVDTAGCSVLACHGDGRGGAPNQAPYWQGTLPADCSGCHSGNAAAGTPITSGVHASHVNQAALLGDNYRCAACHGATVSSGNDRIIASPANHLNATIDIQFVAGGTFDATAKSCAATACHAAGKATAPQPAPPLWSATPLGCNGCHGTGTSSGMPDYPTAGAGQPLANSHSRHVTGSADCGTCHRATTTSGTTIASGSASHTNGTIDVTFAAGAGAGAVWNPVTKSCATTNCHGTSSPVWGGTLPTDCTGCHGGNAAAGTPIASGVHASHVNQAALLGTNYRCAACHSATVGSGSDRTIITAANHMNATADIQFAGGGTFDVTAKSCAATTCHGAGKPTAPQPAPPVWSATPLGCNGCHGTGTSSGMPDYPTAGAGQPLANSHSRHVTGSADCGTCHRATTTSGTTIASGSASHTNGTIDVTFAAGAGANAVWNPVTKSCATTRCHATATPIWGGTLPTDCTGCHGGNAAAGTPIASGVHASHVNQAALLGTNYRCAACHGATVGSGSDRTIITATNHMNTTVDIQFAGGGTYAPAGKSCAATACHGAGKATAPQPATPVWSATPLGCNGCHGTGTSSGMPDYVSAGSGQPLANSHFKHVLSPADCTTCHQATTLTGTSLTGGTSSHTNGAIDVVFAGRAGASAAWDPATKSCTSTNCHNGSTPVWGATLPADCTGCHGGSTLSATPINTGKHPAHIANYSTLGRGNGFSCQGCHASTIDSPTSVSNRNNHGNGFKDYSGPRAGRLSAGTCTTAYCHSTGMPQNQFWNMTTANWGSTRTLGCSGCHGSLQLPDGTFATYTSVAGEPSYANGGPGTPTANSHRAHVPGTGITATTGCAVCHATTVDAGVINKFRDYSTQHLDSVRTVAFAAAIQGRYSTTTQECLNIYCHSNGKPFDNSTTSYATMRWGDTPRTCAACHDDGGTTSRLSGRHAKHTGGFYAFACSRCHFGTVNDDGTLKDRALHTNRAKEITFREGGSYAAVTKGCSSAYCHSDGRGGAPSVPVTWSDTTSMTCYSCHRGTPANSTAANCADTFGYWSTAKNSCTPDLTMSSNGHHRLVGPQWVRKYPCYYCHNNTMNPDGSVKSATVHVNGSRDIAMPSQWSIPGKDAPCYNATTKVCDNVYCHSDGTTDPEVVRPFAWTEPKTSCNSCHGHPTGSCETCHYPHIDSTGKVWTRLTAWPGGEEWRGAMPMFPNQGAGTPRANSHLRHSQTNFTCDNCHADTVRNGVCTTCHIDGIPQGGMGEVAHIDAAFHVNKNKDVRFKDGGSYNPVSKTCTNTKCHTSGTDPKWGGSVNSAVTCLSCHGTTGADKDDYNAFNGTQARIRLYDWYSTGHGRYSTSGRYPKSNNPAANFPGNPCWYCHDNNVLHQDPRNPFRLKMHRQYERRFEKECVYCHMERTDAECIACHVGQSNTLAPQATGSGIVFRFLNTSTETKYPSHRDIGNCIKAGCHDSDSGTFAGGEHKGHNVNAGVWTAEQKLDVKNQYLMMGVCLQCHDDDTSEQCTSCHQAPPTDPYKYALGYNPGTGYIKPKQARASAGHFGYKHYDAFKKSGGWLKHYTSAKSPIFGTYSVVNGTWKGGKFCWDCHDPHGDSNIYMIQNKVATTTDGIFGIPKTRAEVVFTDNASGTNYVRKNGTGVVVFNGICNVCHAPQGAKLSKHYGSDYGDGHNYTRRCTTCHEHRFADSHANKQSCSSNGCHTNAKPVPKHTAFGLPRDCTKCHLGTVGQRMDVIGQMKSNSHHVQRKTGEIKNTDCYQCHWEASSNGLINITYHTGYNYKNYTSVKNDVVDLVVYGPGSRPAIYRPVSSAAGRATVAMFRASNMGTPQERSAVTIVTNHCISCHSDQNNDIMPFDDCKTPRQYAWDGQSIMTRYAQNGTTTWGKYAGTAGATKKNFTKAFSAHGNAAANQGGWDPVNGVDGDLSGYNQRTGNKSVQCFDCHNSHGSKVVGTTSSYVTFNGTNNGANLKETQKNIGGYSEKYLASSSSDGINPYAAGAGQCFDCHNSRNAGTIVPNGKTPWGYFSTFSSNAPVMGYRDTPKFGQGTKAFISKNNGNGWLESRKTIVGGHLKASEPPGSLPNLAKDVGTATGGSITTLVTGKSWAADQWRNLYLLMTSGANSGQLSKITANDATTLTVEGFAAAVGAGDGYKIVPYSAQVNGLCTPCHDPHGVSPTLGAANQHYAVPLLKGTWMTSPYKEDRPPLDPTGNNITSGADGIPRSWGKQYNSPYPTQPSTRYVLDRTTFGGATRIAENDDRFAGLCLNCHQKAMLTDGSNKNQGWKSVDRIHESVKGWGANSEHAYSCSKCHQPHNSGLPRLMLTNCLNFNHRGVRASGGQAWSADSQSSWAHSRGAQHRGFPYAFSDGVWAAQFSGPEATTACHGSAPLNSGNWPNKNLWNNVTPW